MFILPPPQVVICFQQEDATVADEPECTEAQPAPAGETKPIKPLDGGGVTPQSGGGGTTEPPRPK